MGGPEDQIANPGREQSIPFFRLGSDPDPIRIGGKGGPLLFPVS